MNNKLFNNIFIFLIFFLVVTSYKIYLPGLQSDEILFVDVAINGVEATDYFKKLFGIPMLLMSYIGSFKSFVYYPIFKIFSHNLLTIRIFSIIIVCVGIWFFNKAILLTNEKYFGLFFCFLIVTDPSIIFFARVDVGPNSFEFLFKALIFYFLIKYFTLLKNKYLIFIGLVSLLGIFNKLNFIWFINSILFVLFYFFHKKQISLNDFLKKFLTFFIFFILSFAYFCFVYSHFNLQSDLSVKNLNFSQRFIIKTEQFNFLISGQAFLENCAGFKNYPLHLASILIFWISIFIFIILLHKKKYKFDYSKDITFFLSLFLFLCLLGQILITPAAIRPWHFLITYPFLILILSFLLNKIYILGKKKLAVVTLFLIIILRIITIIYYYKIFENNKFRKNWSPAISKLMDITKKTNHTYLVFDWGIRPQLRLNDTTSLKYDDFFEKISNVNLNNKLPDWANREYLHGKKVIFYSETLIKNSSELVKMKRIIFDNNLILIKELTIKYKGDSVFEIYRIL